MHSSGPVFFFLVLCQRGGICIVLNVFSLCLRFKFTKLLLSLIDTQAYRYKYIILESNNLSNKILNHKIFEKNQCFIPSCLLNYIYIVVTKQHDTCLSELFVFAYAIDITFNAQLKTSQYITTQIKIHTKNCCLIICLYHIQNNETILISYKKIHVDRT
jgi:hypothetical protein